MKRTTALPVSTTENQPRRVCVVGAGTRFLSGISYYTLRSVNALAGSHKVSAILMRQLLPTRFYPGRERVGAQLTKQSYAPGVHVLDGVDWYWFPSIFRAIAFLIRERPEIVVFQWWTGTVLHSYLALALLARVLGAKVIIEFHEVLDTGEARLNVVQTYVKCVLPILMHLTSGFVAHSEFDRAALEKQYGLRKKPVVLIPHGPYDHYKLVNDHPPFRAAPASCCNLLFFGVIRPFKGLEDLITAFDMIPEKEIEKYWLTVVGETWEGWTLPMEMIVKSRYRDRITLVNRYVRDEEVAAFFAGADAVVLPYHRSSASGPLHVTMSHGLPVIVTQVGGLVEAAARYEGAVWVPPRDPAALRKVFARLLEMHGKRFVDPHSWERTVEHYRILFDSLPSVQAHPRKPHYV
jgi:glycosyltransferase involved in cell wall biosynthesis